MRNITESLRNSKGFVEIEHLISAAIALILIASFSSVAVHMSSMQKQSDITQDGMSLISDLSMTLKTGSFCSANFQGTSLPPNTTTSFSMPYDMNGAAVTLAANSDLQNGLTVTKMDVFRNPAFPATSVETSSGTLKQVAATIRIGLQRTVRNTVTNLPDRDIPVLFTLDASDKVVYCNTDSDAANACSQSGSKYNPNPNLAIGETSCMPVNHCDFGGTFSNDPTNGFSNPLTGTQGCPLGYTPERTGTVSTFVAKPKYADGISNHYYGISTCMRCGTTLIAQSGAVQQTFDDASGLASVNGEIMNTGGYYGSTYGHITSTGQQAGAYVAPTPLPVTQTPIPPTPNPTATPASTPTGTPQPTPSSTPTDCAGWIALYNSQWGSQCGGAQTSISCPATGNVREFCDDGSKYLSTQGGYPNQTNPPQCQCFTAGTLVTMADGSTKAIEKIDAGEKVRSFDETAHSQFVSTVTKPLHHGSKLQRMFDLEVADGRVIHVNDQHPIYVAEYQRYIVTRDLYAYLALGIKISVVDQDGSTVAVRKMTAYRQQVPTYNLEIDGLRDANALHPQGVGHNYFVEGILVHNLKQQQPCQ